MRILITGGAGFIGSHIAEYYADKAEVRILDNLRTGYQSNLDGFDVELIEGSVTDRGIIKKAVHGVDYVFHLAAMISVSESMEKPCECVEINTQGTLNVLEAAAATGVKKLYLAENQSYTGIYNVAYEKRQTINDIARKIIRLTGSKSKIEYVPIRAGDIRHSLASIEKIAAAGFFPASSVEEGLLETIDYFAQHYEFDDYYLTGD